MKFRPCIDIHNGKVKQIVGGSLLDDHNHADENFVSEQDGGFYASLYKENALTGGHIILLNPVGSEYYEADVAQAKAALETFRGGLQIGGGMNASNAKSFIDLGATHVVVTSYVFKNGKIDYKNLEEICKAVGKEHLVLDLSCRKKDGAYYIVTDRWQKFTDVILTDETLTMLANYCDEFLIHAVDVEGKSSGIETDLVKTLGEWANGNENALPITYAGGVHNLDDLSKLYHLGYGKIDVTIGSALDIFGGSLEFSEVLKFCDSF